MKPLLCPGRPYAHAYKSSLLRTISQHTDADLDEVTRNKILARERNVREEYKKFILQLPKFSGTIIVFGIDKKNKEIILSVFEGKSNLREEFKDHLNGKEGGRMSRQEWIHETIRSKNLREIFLCPAHRVIETESKEE